MGDPLVAPGVVVCLCVCVFFLYLAVGNFILLLFTFYFVFPRAMWFMLVSVGCSRMVGLVPGPGDW